MSGPAYRAGLTVALSAIVASILAQPACATQDVDGQTRSRGDAYAAYMAGEYDDAVRALRAIVESEPADLRARRTLVAVLVETGQYEEAERVARAHQSPELANPLGEVLAFQGRLDEAEAAFRRSVEEGATDANTARLNLAILEWNRGNREAALEKFDGFIDIYNNSSSLSAGDLMAVAEAVRRLGVRNPQLYQDAVKALDEAMAADRGSIDGAPVAFETRVRMGHLFLEKYNSAEAQPLFREVLAENPEHPGALLGMAMAKNFDGSTESLDLVDQSLEVNPDNVDALVFRAKLRLDLEDGEAARADIEKALSINARSLDALTARATAEWLADDMSAYERTRQEVLSIDPAHSSLFNDVAELAVRQRRYAGAVELARQAVELDPLNAMAWGTLGLNQLRIGEIDEGRASLETSFERDPYNPWIKNTLDLLDTFDEYETVTVGRFELMLHESEAELMAPYLGELAEEAYTELAERYGYSPPTPVRVEVYPRHADFSVRTVGLAGLGALGVCFGNVLAVISPAAASAVGEFNWGSTLWHELTHTMTLGVSNHRVPRWLTEGLSVLEERRARPGWGDDLSPMFLASYKAGDLFPVSSLSQGFVRPRYPEQVQYSYYQASLVAEMIEEERGFDTILAMLRAYGEGMSDVEVFDRVLGIEPEQFDDRFDNWLKDRYETQLASVPAGQREEGGMIERALGAMRGGATGFPGEMRRGRELVESGKSAEAIEVFERAKALFPEYAGPGSPYEMLAQIHLELGDTAAAALEMQALTAIDENRYGVNVTLAQLLEKLGDAEGAVAALERAIHVSPYEQTLHEQMVELYTETGNPLGVVSARRALLALGPVDRADALYRLALAWEAAGDTAAARREVVRALEMAPNFIEAQELLLRLRGRTP